MTVSRLAFGIVTCATLATGCESLGIAYGDANSVIAVMSAERWDEFSDDVYASLERTVVTVRDEKTFTVTYQEPYGDRWRELSRFRRILLVGELGDPWVQEALEHVDPPVSEPGLYRAQDVWSRGQTLMVAVLGDAPAEEMSEHLPVVYAQLDQDFRVFARSRMYTTGVDTALADTLLAEAGFGLLVPDVWRWSRTDSTYAFRNDNPDPAELIREVSVSWISPAPEALPPDSVLAWRARVVADHYSEPQDVVPDGMTFDRLAFAGYIALEIRGQWTNPPDRGWPAGGPFITRAAVCEAQDRAYLLDAWLYAPALEKYEYIIQLETILDTFRCN
ncbi:MAG: DUF4837 family protein [Longimicrobiales bacterium]